MLVDAETDPTKITLFGSDLLIVAILKNSKYCYKANNQTDDKFFNKLIFESAKLVWFRGENVSTCWYIHLRAGLCDEGWSLFSCEGIEVQYLFTA